MIPIKKLQAFAVELDTLISDGPRVSPETMDDVDDYLKKLKSYQSTLDKYAGQAEILYNTACINQIQNCDSGLWEKVKKSSTMQIRLCIAKCPEEYAIHSELMDKKKTLSETSFHYNTLISYQKEYLFQGRKTPTQFPVKEDPLKLE